MKEILTVKEVMEYFEIGESTAYKLIKSINDELQKEGFLILRGRVNRKRLFERMGLDN
ncbi:Helix-turn-helix domain-containing protein [Cetobacterium ceti]|uniref:Helix-turn-helix domain-containing protein n=1 Tax=Cetobacterium ceti TaxID=180163 RepID=A0A1T4PWD9_9FUSO|nr:helix-turn-helix domain-containing protein [Cetobacterium ceti]SJZ95779.1 Helix-turn-helix domain-containing protein [Cetobacterium ceti]